MTSAGPGRQRLGLVTVLVRRPGGPSVQDWVLTRSDPTGKGEGIEVGRRARVVAQDAAAVTPAVVVALPDEQSGGAVVVLLALPAADGRAARARVYAGGAGVSPVLAEAPVRDGAARLEVDASGPAPDGVELLDGAGGVLWRGTTETRPGAVDDLGVPVPG